MKHLREGGEYVCLQPFPLHLNTGALPRKTYPGPPLFRLSLTCRPAYIFSLVHLEAVEKRIRLPTMGLDIELFKSSRKVPATERLATIREIGLLGKREKQKKHPKKKNPSQNRSETRGVGEEESDSCTYWRQSSATGVTRRSQTIKYTAIGASSASVLLFLI